MCGWLSEHGLISNYEDFLGLPYAVLEDAGLAMEAEAAEQKRQGSRPKGRR
jgi:hypothetical protein